jgi:hypothetical protein
MENEKLINLYNFDKNSSNNMIMDKNILYNFEKKANDYIEKPGINYKQIKNIFNPNTDL